MKQCFQALLVILVVGIVSAPRPAAAQFFINPALGYDFGGDSGCVSITNCKDKKLNVAFSFGGLFNFLGFDEELAYAKDFRGRGTELNSSVFTVMLNMMAAPKIRGTRPYALIGMGLVKDRVGFGQLRDVTTDNNTLGWDAGGGIFVNGKHFGFRGDVRYYHSFRQFKALKLVQEGEKLDFGRISVGLLYLF